MSKPVQMLALLVSMVFAILIYLLLYNFSGRTPRIHYHGYTLTSGLRTENPIYHRKGTSFKEVDLDTENVNDIIDNLLEDVREIKMKLKQLVDNNTVNVKKNAETDHLIMSGTLLTLFSTWTRSDDMSTIHKNTLKNWASFKPVVNPVLFTNDSVMAEEALAGGWTTLYIPRTAENGLPVLKYMYIEAMKTFDSTYYCYANSDMLFDGGIIKTLVNLAYTLGNEFLTRPVFLTGLRWNVINVSEKEISRRRNISKLIKERGQPFVTSAEDYFITNKIYPWHDIPEVVVGAIAYDNWLVVNAREKKHLTINTSRTIPALHQSLDANDHRSHMRDTVNYNADLLKNISNINIPYHKGFLDCIEKYTDFVNDTFVLGDRMVNKYCN